MVSLNVPVGAERAEHLVGRDVLEAEARAGVGVELAPVGEGGFEQGVGAADVGLDEGRGAVDRAVDVALGGKMQDGIGLEAREDTVDRGPVAMSTLKCVCRLLSRASASDSRLPA